MTTLMKCLACGEIQQVEAGDNICACRRSTARMDGVVVELQGPAKLLVPADEVTTLDGVPWTTIPEEPLLVRVAAA